MAANIGWKNFGEIEKWEQPFNKQIDEPVRIYKKKKGLQMWSSQQ